MKQVHDYGGRACGCASFMLCINYLFVPRALQNREKNLEEVGPILDKIAHLFPVGGFFKFIHSHYCLKSGDTDGALDYLNQAVDLISQASGTTPNNYLFELALLNILTLNFSDAATVLKQLVETTKEFESQGIATLELAVCKLKMGDKEGADNLIKNLHKTTHKANKFALDKIELLKHIDSTEEKHTLVFLSIFELMYLRRDLANLKVEHAEPLYQVFLEDVCKGAKVDEKSKAAGDIEAGIHVVKGQFLRQLGKRAESDDEFHKALLLESKVRHEKQWIAFSYYELAETMYLMDVKAFEQPKDKKLELLNEVKKNLDKCNKLSGYPYEEVLHTRVKLALKQVEAEIKELK